MRLKLRYALPLAQMALAVALLHWSDVWLRAAMRVADSPGVPPALTALRCINAPVVLVRGLWNPLVRYPWDDAIFVATIGIFWYWVALNIQSWRQRGTVLLFGWVPLRITTDLVLIGLGVFVCFVFGTASYLPLEGLWAWFLRISVLAWSLGSVFLFGRDLIQCLRPNKALIRKTEPA